jgi:hypothetical protein
MVVGEPLDVSYAASPSPELVDSVHAKYLVALQQLFDDNKVRFSHKGDIVFR